MTGTKNERNRIDRHQHRHQLLDMMIPHYLRATAISLAALLAAAPLRGAESPAPNPQMFHYLEQPLSAAPTYPDSIAGMEHTYRPPGDGSFASLNGYNVDISSREVSLLFYRTVFASSENVASGWNGNVSTCAAGDTSKDFKDATLRRINWHRAMAGVPSTVSFDTVFSQKAQQSAMLMSANNQLNHFPPNTWTCYNATAAEAASHSNLSLGTFGPSAITGYIGDPGSNNSIVGHRRWILYPQTLFMGTGDVDRSATALGTWSRANDLWVFDANIFNPRPAVRDDFVAWPPKGYVPYTTVFPRWSLSYPGADFSMATVSMTENGTTISTKTEKIANGYGENTLVWYPGSYVDDQTWSKPKADVTYTVSVSNVKIGATKRSFNYDVTVFDPDTSGADSVVPQVIGGAAINLGQSANYKLTLVPGADAYQWRSIDLSSFSFFDDAESGTGNFTVNSSDGYNVIANDVSASGTSSFHLAHAVISGQQLHDQTLTLNDTVFSGTGTMLTFASRLGLSASSQIAQVEISTDDGVSWTAAWSQAGVQSGSTSSFGESSFSIKSVSLSPWANRTIRLRFNYHLSCCGPIYPQTTTGIGWYIDDMKITDAQQVSAIGMAQTISLASFDFTPVSAGSKALQVRPGMYGYFSDWGPLSFVSTGGSLTTATLGQRSDCLFNWAERAYPQVFSPVGAKSAASAPYYFRYYSDTATYLATSSTDNHIWVLGPLSANRLLDIGPITNFLATAGCSQ